jgi:hypothetical protein
MLTTEQIQENLVLMANTIEAFNSLDVSKTLDYLSEVVSLQSTATETQASAKYHLLKAINAELDRQAKLLKKDDISPSIKKMRADSMCADYHYIYEKCVRYSSNISHTIDAVRTKISYLKSEMENARFN